MAGEARQPSDPGSAPVATTTASTSMSAARLSVAAVCLLAYAAPLFAPPLPVPLGTTAPPDASLLARIFPSVPSWWVAVRLAALAVGAVLLSRDAPRVFRQAQREPIEAPRGTGRVTAGIALGLALAQACAAPFVSHLGPVGQTGYLAMLFAPAAMLALRVGDAKTGASSPRRATAAVIGIVALWTAIRFATDLGSPRVADVIDGWRGMLDLLGFVTLQKSLLTDLFDFDLPGLGGVLTIFHGMPLYRSGVLTLTFRSAQVFQILCVAGSAVGVAMLTRMLVAPAVAAVAVAVYLFAPYTRFVTLFPGPFLAGPIYAAAVALCAVVAVRQGSAAAVAALGACAGIAITFPGVVPIVAFFVAWTGWELRDRARELRLAGLAALATFAAAALPAVPNVLNPFEVAAHLRFDGLISLIDAALLGQVPVGSYSPYGTGAVPRPLDVVVAALLAPFAHPRIAIRLWGDAIIDPLGGALAAVGLAACARSARHAWPARVLLLFFFAALCPAFVSPVDVVDIVHAVALPVPLALLAAVGCAVVLHQLGWPSRRRAVALAGATAAICVGGTVLFDVVNPRILSASAIVIVLRTVRGDALDRAVVMDYARALNPHVRWLMTGTITAFAAERIGFLEYGGGPLPSDDLAAEGKDLLFWSPGLEADLRVSRTVCAQWPHAALYEVADDARLGRVHAARLGIAEWTPAATPDRWRVSRCASSDGGGDR